MKTVERLALASLLLSLLACASRQPEETTAYSVVDNGYDPVAHEQRRQFFEEADRGFREDHSPEMTESPAVEHHHAARRMVRCVALQVAVRQGIDCYWPAARGRGGRIQHATRTLSCTFLTLPRWRLPPGSYHCVSGGRETQMTISSHAPRRRHH